MEPGLMVISGVAMFLAGLVWRLNAGEGFNRETLKTNKEVTYGVLRTTNVLMMVGLIWAGFGVFEWVN